jgi:hypothetical protein
MVWAQAEDGSEGQPAPNSKRVLWESHRYQYDARSRRQRDAAYALAQANLEGFLGAAL